MATTGGFVDILQRRAESRSCVNVVATEKERVCTQRGWAVIEINTFSSIIKVTRI